MEFFDVLFSGMSPVYDETKADIEFCRSAVRKRRNNMEWPKRRQNDDDVNFQNIIEYWFFNIE